MSGQTQKTLEHSRITVGIVTYNSAGTIEACLESVKNHLKDAIPTVIVLDNASSDGTLDVLKKIKKKFPYPLEILNRDKNRGYAWGVNRIAEQVNTEWICFMNPDARLLAPCFDYAREVIRKVPTCGVISGIITDPDGEPQESGGAFPTPLMAIWDWCGLRHIFPRVNWSTTIKLDIRNNKRLKRIDYPTGAFWILRWEVFNRVGPFDERFFLYFEETDFCKRAREIGWPCYIHPGIRIEHNKGASFTESPNINDPDYRDPLSIYFESLWKYLYKHFPQWKVKNAIRIIRAFLRLRKLIKKDEKSEKILTTFEDGLTKAEGYSDQSR